MPVMTADELSEIVVPAFERAGLSVDDARTLSDWLIDSDLRGISSHGVRLAPLYVARLRHGSLNSAPRQTVTHLAPTLVSIDGDDGPGQLVLGRAMETALGVAKEHGSCLAWVHGSNHVGALGMGVRSAAERGAFAYATQVTRNSMAMAGGSRAVLGNNPLAYAFPSHRGHPVTFDIACSAMAHNHLRDLAERGDPLPEGIFLDAQGSPSTSPDHVEEAIMLPFAGHKGAGLALMNAFLAGALSGSEYGATVKPQGVRDAQRNLGHFIMVIDLPRLMDEEQYFARVGRLLDEIVDPQTRIPGDGGEARRREAQRTGVEIPDVVISRLTRAGQP